MLRPLRTIRTLRRFQRYREVLFTLLKYGFDDIVDRIGPEVLFWRRPRRRLAAEKREAATPRRLRYALSDLGPTFVKLGQLLSTRPDILPEEYITELERLQDKVPPFPFSEVRRIVEDELHRPLEELFKWFQPEPLASGSVAQVHRGCLYSGQIVAIKVQRPGITRLIETDLEILSRLASSLEHRIPEMRWFRPSVLVVQFAASIRKELDFVAEGQSAERLRNNFADEPTYIIPQVYWDYSTTKVLTTDFIEGIKITNFEQLEAKGLNRSRIARIGARAILREVFEHRFFHGDPHPGNFFIVDDDKIGVVDFGIVGRLDEETAEGLEDLLSGLVSRDATQVFSTMKRIGMFGDSVDEPTFKLDLLDFIDRYYGLPLKKIEVDRAILDLFQILRRHQVMLPANLALMGRMLVVSAGVARMLDPDFDMVGEAKPFIQKLLARRFDPRRMAREVLSSWQDYRNVLRALPSDMEEILSKLKKGKMLVSLHHEGLNRFILEMDRASNRLAFGVIIAALIVGSSLVMQLERGPSVFGFSALGLTGYLIAGVLGLWLVLAILRSGRI